MRLDEFESSQPEVGDILEIEIANEIVETVIVSINRGNYIVESTSTDLLESKLNEVDPRNYDSDIDYYDAVRRSGRRPSSDDYEPSDPGPSDEDIYYAKQKASMASAPQQRQIDSDGQAPNGERYNTVVTFTSADNNRNKIAADSYKDYHWGAKKVVDSKQDNGVYTLYVVDNHKHGMWKAWKDQPAAEGIKENYPKHQDLSGVSTDKLKAYLARQSQQSVPGEGNQVKRVQAELQRRSQGVAEAATPASVSKVLRLIQRHKSEWLDNYGLGEVEDTVVDMAEMGQFQGMSAEDALALVGQELESLYGQQGVAEGGYPEVDHMPGPTIKRTQTGCKRCHGKGYVYKTPDGEVHPMNRPDAKKYKCGKCDGIGFVKVTEQGVAEVSTELRNRYVTRASDDYSNANFASRVSKDHPGLDDYSREQQQRAKKRAAGLNRALSDKRLGREGNLKEFVPGNGGGESGRWYTDDQMTDIVGDGWWNDLDVSGDIPKQQMIQEAQAWLDDQGYNVQVLNCKLNDDDMDWFIEGSFTNPGFAKKGVAEGGFKNMYAEFSGYGNYMQGRAVNVFKTAGLDVVSKEYSEDDDIQTYVVKGDRWAIEKAGEFLERNPEQFGGYHLVKQGVAEAHPNSKIYDKCWDGHKKVPGKKRGEEGSCVKESLNERAEKKEKVKVYVKNPKTGRVVKVDFGEPGQIIKKSKKHRKHGKKRWNLKK